MSDKPQPSIKKNFVYRTFYEVLLVISPVLTAPYVARVLGSDGVGAFSFTTSMMTFFTMFAALGTASYGMREIAQHRDEPEICSKLFWEIELMTVGTSGICLIVWFIVSFFYTDYRVYLFALTPVLLGKMFDISWYFTGKEMVRYTVVIHSIVRILSIVLLFLLVHDKDDLLIYFLLHSFATFISSLSMWVYLPKLLVHTDFKTLTFKRHFHETLIYFIPSIATTVYTVLDKFLLGIITHDDNINGYYEEAYKVIKIAKSVVFISVNAVMGARISYLYAKEKFDEIKRRITRSMDFILLTGFGCAFGIAGVAKRFVPLFFGPGFDDVIPLLYLMSPLIIIIGVSNCLGSQYFTPSGQRKRSAKVIVAGSFINLCLNLMLIPRFKAEGATIASIIAEGVITVCYVLMSAGYMTFYTLVSLSWKRVIAGGIMCALIYYAGNILTLQDILAVPLQIIAGCAVYGVLLLLMRDSMLLKLMKDALEWLKKRKPGHS